MKQKVFEPKHYSICSDCAKSFGGVWPEGHVATVMMGICKYCNDPKEQTIIPYVDFNWPSKELTRRAAMNRD